MMRKSVALALLLAATYGGQALAQDDTVIYGSVLTSSLKKHAFYNLLINNILYLCVT